MDERDHQGRDGDGPVTVARYWNDAEAGMAKSLLEAHGIPAVLSSEVPHSVMPITVDGLGEVRVNVPAAMAEEAREILREVFEGSPHGEPWDEGDGDDPPEA